MKPLRIVHALTHHKVTRGGAIQALLLARSQIELGHQVQVVCNSRPDRPVHRTFEPWMEHGIQIHPFEMERPAEVLRFRKFLNAIRPDVLHAHRDTALLFAYFATMFQGPPAFVSQRGTTHSFRTRTVAFVHRSDRVHRIVAVAGAVKDALVQEGVPARRVAVVYGSFDVDRFDPAQTDGSGVRRELGLAAGQPLVVQIGQLNRKKAPTSFIRMAKEVLRHRPDVLFALAGQGSMKERCVELIAKLGVERNVKLLGFRRDVPELYRAAAVAVNCSTNSEGLTGALREALAMAVPVAATQVDGNPEAVQHGVTGLLVPPRDEEAMATAVLDLLDHPDKARRYGRAGRELVLSLMHPLVRVSRTEQVYRDVLAERGFATARRDAPVAVR